ncbi:MAG: hypothetical protein HZA17_08090 [Nitrospirae bacterium]|nr:hypothetical protein [Nitrospirota bacterium]
MTPLDRLIELFPLMKVVLPWVSDHLPLLVGIPFVLVIVLVFIWAGYIAPRRAKRILKSMLAREYSPLPLDDPHLQEAVTRLTPLIFTTYREETVREKGPWRVELAYVQTRAGRTRFFAHLSRFASISTSQVTRRDRDFSLVFLETVRMPVDKEVHVVGDGYRLDPEHGLQKVEAGIEAPLPALFDFYTEDASLAAFPAALKEALLECSPFLSLRGTRKKGASYLFHARLKFTPNGWGLVSDEFVHSAKKMDELMNAVERISQSLS